MAWNPDGEWASQVPRLSRAFVEEQPKQLFLFVTFPMKTHPVPHRAVLHQPSPSRDIWGNGNLYVRPEPLSCM